MSTLSERIHGYATQAAACAQTCREHVEHAAEQVQTFVYWLERKVCQLIDGALPPAHAFLFKKIITAIPEILFTASALTGYMPIPAMLFWSTRLVSASWPLIKSILKGEVQAEHLGPAAAATFENLKQNYKKLWPAIAIGFAVSSVAYGTLGWLTNDMSLFARSVLYFGVSSVANYALFQEANAQAPQQIQNQNLANTG